MGFPFCGESDSPFLLVRTLAWDGQAVVRGLAGPGCGGRDGGDVQAASGGAVRGEHIQRDPLDQPVAAHRRRTPSPAECANYFAHTGYDAD